MLNKKVFDVLSLILINKSQVGFKVNCSVLNYKEFL